MQKDAFYTRESEIKQIESVIPEIEEKIKDTRDMEQQTVKKLGDKALMDETEMRAGNSVAAAAAFDKDEEDEQNGEGKEEAKKNGSSNGKAGKRYIFSHH